MNPMRIKSPYENTESANGISNGRQARSATPAINNPAQIR